MIKGWIKKSLVDSGALRAAAKFTGRGAAIIMYHSVMDDPRGHAQTLGGITHTTDEFRGQIEAIVKDYDPVTLEDVLRYVRGEGELPARPVVITFDDGYADNYEVVHPVLKAAGMSAAFYVTVDSIDKRELPWPGRVRYAFLNSRGKKWIEPGGREWPLMEAAQRVSAFDRACEYFGKMVGEAQREQVRCLEKELDSGSAEDGAQLMMSWDQVRGLARAGHIVGSHTMTHPNMAHIANADVMTEFAESKRRLEEELSRPVVHFSYPCPALQPHWAESTVKMSREVGYESAVTTNGGLVRKRDNPLCLRRIRPTKDVNGLRWNLESVFLGRKV